MPRARSTRLPDYTHAIRCDPKHAEAYNARGLLYKSQGDAEKALKDYSAAIRANPAYAKAYLNRGSIHADKKQNVKAVEEFNAAINHHATFAEAYNARGMIRYREKEYDLAIRDFDQALLHESNLKTKAHFFSNRGFAKQMKNDTPGAIDDYNKAINADPSFWAAWHNRGLAYKEIGDDLRAAMDLSKARELKLLAAAEKTGPTSDLVKSQEETAGDAELLGTWKLLSATFCETDRLKEPGYKNTIKTPPSDEFWVIGGHEILVKGKHRDGREYVDRWRIDVDTKNSPKPLTLSMDGGKDTPKIVQAIYRRSGDTLEMCSNTNGLGLPRGFEVNASTGMVAQLLTFKRVAAPAK